MKKLVIIRGLPGSGKSTLAKKMVEEGKADIYFEADMFFVDPLTGEYKFVGEKIGEAHHWCQYQTFLKLESDKTVIVSNTFTRKKEMEDYIYFAEQNEVPVEIIVCRENYGSVHGVPPEVVERMKARWEE